jgi:hypothetical protein
MTKRNLSKAFSVEVKHSKKGVFRFSSYVNDVSSRSHIYILVNVKFSKKNGEVIRYYIIPSTTLCKLTILGNRKIGKPVVLAKDVQKYEGRWP